MMCSLAPCRGESGPIHDCADEAIAAKRQDRSGEFGISERLVGKRARNVG